ncbi:nitrilase-related carbon-nitrogen hydrolase [Streptomyces sp. NPDC018947]|uniref:nitrilase-related carbon-nitrogen hydrolase n=1 Tax=Streptomyces sp. NPDC018947 TaxID=3365054 RepID=UPI0037B80754
MSPETSTPRRTVTAAVVQASAPLFDTPTALARAEELIREAAGRGAEVVVLPEAFLGGYPKGLDFDVTVGSRTPAGRDLFRRYHAAAVEVPGPEVEALAALTRELGCHAVVGAVERRGGTLYCVALFFGPGGYLGLHRKLMPTAAERYVWGQGDGSTLPVVDTGQGDEPDTVLIGGGSVIVSPLGEVLAGPLRDGEGILTAELDLDDLARARFDLDVTGHYARPDVFTLHVDASARTAVTTS